MEERSKNNKDRLDAFDDTYAFSKPANRSISQIFQEIVDHVTEIIRAEVRLARAEVRQDLTHLLKAGAFVVIGAVLALYALGFLLLSIVYVLGNVVAPWLSAIIVGGSVAVIAAIVLQVGRAKIKQASLKPNKTIQSLQENVTWMKNQIK